MFSEITSASTLTVAKSRGGLHTASPEPVGLKGTGQYEVPGACEVAIRD